MTILRALAGLVLGMIIFAGLLYYLVVVNFSQRLEDPEVHRLAIDETDAYNRIYDEVLVDEALEDKTANLLGGVEFDVQHEAIEILRDILPPAYLREQTEDNIDRFTNFLKEDQERLEVLVDLEEPLQRVKPAILDRVYQGIDELKIKRPGSAGCSDANLQRLAADSALPFARLSDGELPESAPYLGSLTPDCRSSEFDSWFDRVLDDPAMNSEATRILEGERQTLRESFVAGDPNAFLRRAATPLITPVIDDALRDIRRDLQRGDRLDLLEKLAENSDDLTREDIDEQAESLRDVVRAANGPGRIIALLMVIVGSLLLAVVYFPRPADMLRWPGLVLLLGGGVCLVVGFVLNSAIPGRIKDAVIRPVSYSSDVPVAAINLAGDLGESFARQMTAGFIPAAVTVMVIGGVLLVASLFAAGLWAAVRRVLPSGNGNGNQR